MDLEFRNYNFWIRFSRLISSPLYKLEITWWPCGLFLKCIVNQNHFRHIRNGSSANFKVKYHLTFYYFTPPDHHPKSLPPYNDGARKFAQFVLLFQIIILNFEIFNKYKNEINFISVNEFCEWWFWFAGICSKRQKSEFGTETVIKEYLKNYKSTKLGSVF